MTDNEPHFNDKAPSSRCTSSDTSIWNSLKSWVQEEKHGGGHVHPALHLQAMGTPDNRGVVATQPIAPGELLIRLPISCALSGRIILLEQSPKFAESLRQKSSWMQCVAAYYHALSQQHDGGEKKWKPYLDSLPRTYETLFQWSDEEIKTHLRGTTLGAMILADRMNGSMETRYQTAVRPVLQELSLLKGIQEEDEMKIFLNACMCISTRGFHYKNNNNKSSDDNDDSLKSDDSYQGPFLLPIMDLLNHNPSKSCTTLQYSDGCFCMVAERPIAQGGEIFHSYGDDTMTSAQLLQTFGFVMDAAAAATTTKRQSWTPASLSKTKHLVPACQEIKQSGIPKRLESKLAALEEGEEEWWEVSNLPIRDEDGILSDDLLIDCSSSIRHDEDNSNDNHNTQGLTDEWITWMCLQFLPQEAYNELCDEGTGKVSSSLLLDATILQDLYLGILVCRSLLLALHKKLNEYEGTKHQNDNPATCVCETTNGVLDRLGTLLEEPIPSTVDNNRAQYGWTIRKEELSNLKIWGMQVSCMMECLYDELKQGGGDDANKNTDEIMEPNAKRTKVEAE